MLYLNYNFSLPAKRPSHIRKRKIQNKWKARMMSKWESTLYWLLSDYDRGYLRQILIRGRLFHVVAPEKIQMTRMKSNAIVELEKVIV